MIKYLDELRKDDVVYRTITKYLENHPDFEFPGGADDYLPLPLKFKTCSVKNFRSSSFF